MKKILLIALCISIAAILYRFHISQSSSQVRIQPSPIPTQTSESRTNFFSCDNDSDCSLDSKCVESSICPPCLTDENDRPVGNCTCTSVKKCEPK